MSLPQNMHVLRINFSDLVCLVNLSKVMSWPEDTNVHRINFSDNV